MRIGIVMVVVLLWPAAPSAAQAPTLGNLAFMAGCWNGDAGRGRVIVEYWTAPTSNAMLGTTRYLGGDRMVSWEFTEIVADSAGVTMTPHPRGQTPTPFRLVRLAPDTAVFENPAHDFPQRIIYRRAADTLVARIEADTPRARGTEWRMGRTACS
jgi:hypothetical protein